MENITKQDWEVYYKVRRALAQEDIEDFINVYNYSITDEEKETLIDEYIDSIDEVTSYYYEDAIFIIHNFLDERGENNGIKI